MIKNKKISFAGRISERFDLPVGTFERVSFVEAAGNREVTVSGCEGLLTYTDSKAVLRLCDGILTVCGDELELRSFAGGRVSVRGVVNCIIYGEDGKESDVN